MNLVNFLNHLNEIFDDRTSLDAQAVASLEKSGHLKMEDALTPRQVIALNDHSNSGEVGRMYVGDKIVYYDRFVTDHYKAPRLVPLCETFMTMVFTPRRDLVDIIASVPVQTMPIVIAPPLIPEHFHPYVVS